MNTGPQMHCREEQARKNRLQAAALLSEAAAIERDRSKTAPACVVRSANYLMHALTVIDKKPMAESILKMLRTIKDWSVAHDYLDAQREAENAQQLERFWEDVAFDEAQMLEQQPARPAGQEPAGQEPAGQQQASEEVKRRRVSGPLDAPSEPMV